MISGTLKEKIEALPAILSIKEAAAFFSVPYLTVYRLIRRKELSAYKDGDGNWCLNRTDLKTFCSRNSNL